MNKHLVAFIDILGFEEMILKHFDGTDTSALKNLEAAVNKEIGGLQELITTLNSTSLYNLSINQFSDCVSFSLEVKGDSELLHCVYTFSSMVAVYQRELMKKGIFIRGAISYDYHYQSDNLIFSKGLVQSYKNESKLAIYPRVIFDKELQKLIKSLVLKETGSYDQGLFNTIIIRDWDDICFLNPFDYKRYKHMESFIYSKKEQTIAQKAAGLKFIINHHNSYESSLKKVNQKLQDKNLPEKVIRKYIWLKEFLLWHNNPNKARIRFEGLIAHKG